MLPADFWAGERSRLLAVLQPRLEELARAGIEAGTRNLARAGIAFDSELVNAEAARWARQHTDDLLDVLGTTSERVVGEALAGWIETPGSTIGDLAEQLAPKLGGNMARGEMVAVTEITRAYAEGEAVVYRQAGVQNPVFLPPGHPRCRCWTAVMRKGDILVVVWKTNRDEVVCRDPVDTPWGKVEGCRKLHNVILSEGEWLGEKI